MPRGARKRSKGSRLVPPPGLEEFVTCRVCGAEFMFLNYRHLEQHGLSGDQYKRKYGEDFLVSPLLRWQRAAAQRRRASQKPILPRSRGEMLRDLRRYARERGAPLTLNWLKERDPNLIRQSVQVLGGGGWRGVLKAAGLKGSWREEWTRQRILDGIRGRASKGAALSRTAMRRQASRLLEAGRYHFGTWEKAVAAAGYDYQRHRMHHEPWTRGEVISDLRAWVKGNGPLSYKQLFRSDRFLCAAATQAFGGIKSAARKLGLPYLAYSRVLKWTRERIIEVLVSRLKNRQSLSVRQIVSDEGGLYIAAIRYWGSWKAVRAAAETASRSGKHGGDTR